jgi:hypothetical protein
MSDSQPVSLIDNGLGILVDEHDSAVRGEQHYAVRQPVEQRHGRMGGGVQPSKAPV